MTQITLDFEAGQSLAVTGMNMAVESANKKEKDWSKRTWQLFLFWLRALKRGSTFMIEQFRSDMYEKDLIIPPPSERAYGFLSHKASRSGYIQFVETKKVKNKKAHAANAAVWRRI